MIAICFIKTNSRLCHKLHILKVNPCSVESSQLNSPLNNLRKIRKKSSVSTKLIFLPKSQSCKSNSLPEFPTWTVQHNYRRSIFKIMGSPGGAAG